jgi:hypothetical protein
MRRPRHRDVLELASDIKGIDPDSTSAEHETARDRWKAGIILLKVAAAARAMEMEAAEKANAHALGVANARMQSPINWTVEGVAFVMVLALIFLSWFMVSSRLTATSPRQR